MNRRKFLQAITAVGAFAGVSAATIGRAGQRKTIPLPAGEHNGPYITVEHNAERRQYDRYWCVTSSYVAPNGEEHRVAVSFSANANVNGIDTYDLLVAAISLNEAACVEHYEATFGATPAVLGIDRTGMLVQSVFMTEIGASAA